MSSNKSLAIMGIDVSTKTGIAVFIGGVFHHSEVVQAPKNVMGMERLRFFAKAIQRRHKEYHIDGAVIEGYGFANSNSLATVVEVGTIIRYFLFQIGVPYIEVPPNTLKKYVTGSGAGKKEMVLKEIFKRWGYDLKTNDEADAAGLALFGIGLLDKHWVDLPKSHLEAITTYRKKNKGIGEFLKLA